ncbi:hypothetical protein AXG93_4510s1240 [Marchantia polymorpha subsp. ruderalis]|uniref:Uncharacterized protein n=1 Tax=Marchantia polymorpha subsp. ruderalis TaxID=1480154 RepID=A0A176WDM9_MARPO|nr:hypothetical protein AXG93_4510s1240 [Marchantia polymorpha subsp. ruderalis]
MQQEDSGFLNGPAQGLSVSIHPSSCDGWLSFERLGRYSAADRTGHTGAIHSLTAEAYEHHEPSVTLCSALSREIIQALRSPAGSCSRLVLFAP